MNNSRDQVRTSSRDKAMLINQRNLKALQKQSARERKYTKDSKSEGDASRDLSEVSEGEESDIICTKSKSFSSKVRNKRIKKTA